jgi:hypothetical protein
VAEAPLLELGVAPGGLGRPISLFSPILREPSLMLEVVDLNGSGAATLESFYIDLSTTEKINKWYGKQYLFALGADHDILSSCGEVGSVVRAVSERYWRAD